MYICIYTYINCHYLYICKLSLMYLLYLYFSYLYCNWSCFSDAANCCSLNFVYNAKNKNVFSKSTTHMTTNNLLPNSIEKREISSINCFGISPNVLSPSGLHTLYWLDSNITWDCSNLLLLIVSK